MNDLIAEFKIVNNLFEHIITVAPSLYPQNILPRYPTILVHSSLSAFGYVSGGEGIIASALISATHKHKINLMMPAHSDTVPPDYFDKEKTTCYCMGRIPEWFRKMPRIHRSNHPVLSFSASGPYASRLVRNHQMKHGLGCKSPIGRLYHNDGLILMLGTSWNTCTALHLAEYPLAGQLPKDAVTCAARRIIRFGPFNKIVYEQADDIAYTTINFERIGRIFEQDSQNHIKSGLLDNGTWRLVRIRKLVDTAREYLGTVN